MKKAEKAVLIGLVLSVLIGSFTAFAGECDSVRSHVLRLHILANSDSEQDQTLKLKVRDRILEEAGHLFEDAENLADAESNAQSSLELVRSIAEEEVREQGFDYPVSAELCNMFFDTRRYDGVTMPAGRYDAVRITIGEAKGHNWWCVLYPPMCLPAAQPRQELEEALSESEVELVTSEPKYEIRFACVELIERIKEAIWGERKDAQDISDSSQ